MFSDKSFLILMKYFFSIINFSTRKIVLTFDTILFDPANKIRAHIKFQIMFCLFESPNLVKLSNVKNILDNFMCDMIMNCVVGRTYFSRT